MSTDTLTFIDDAIEIQQRLHKWFFREKKIANDWRAPEHWRRQSKDVCSEILAVLGYEPQEGTANDGQ